MTPSPGAVEPGRFLWRLPAATSTLGAMIDRERFVALFRSAARQAGAVASHLQGKVIVERKEAGGIPESEAVTAVDRATQDVLLLRLHEVFPDVAVDAEEDTETVALFAPEAPDRPLVVVDPVDGTLAYTRGSDDWAVMGALIEAGLYSASVLFFPAHRLTCWAIRGAGCWVAVDGEPARKIDSALGAPDRLLVAPFVPRHRMDRARELGLEPVRSRCSAVDATAPAIRRARASIAGDRADRRRAIGFLPTIEAGGAVRFGDRVWRGEDPAGFPEDAAPSVAADSDELADAIVRLFS